MLLEITLIFLGLIFSHFLNDLNFLILNFEFMNAGSIFPDFMIIFIIYFSLKKDKEAIWAIWLGFFAGLIEDSTIINFISETNEFTTLFGLHSLVYTIIGFTLSQIKRHIDINNTTTIIIVVLVATLVNRFLIWLIIGISDEFYESYSIIAPSLYTAFISPIWFALLKFIYERKELM